VPEQPKKNEAWQPHHLENQTAADMSQEEWEHLHRRVVQGSPRGWPGFHTRRREIEAHLKSRGRWHCWNCERWNDLPMACPQCGRSPEGPATE
jgi:hypothetical protein